MDGLQQLGTPTPSKPSIEPTALPTVLQEPTAEVILEPTALPTTTRIPREPVQNSQQISGDSAFTAGYLAAGGPDYLLRHLLEDVRPCEGQFGIAYSNGYKSAFQFTPGTWGFVEGRAGRSLNPLDPYDTGIAVAELINYLGPVKAGTTAGWPVCWHKGSIP